MSIVDTLEQLPAGFLFVNHPLEQLESGDAIAHVIKAGTQQKPFRRICDDKPIIPDPAALFYGSAAFIAKSNDDMLFGIISDVPCSKCVAITGMVPYGSEGKIKGEQ